MDCKECANFKPREKEPKSGTWSINEGGQWIALVSDDGKYVGSVEGENDTSACLDKFMKKHFF